MMAVRRDRIFLTHRSTQGPPKKTCCAAFVLCLLSTVAPSVADDQNWPQWRGPAGSGVTTTNRVVIQWGPDQNVKWKIDLPEPGNSTPIVWEDKVFFTQPLSGANERSLFCVDRDTGREIWRRGVVDDRPEASHKTNPYCSASPVTDGKRVIACLFRLDWFAGTLPVTNCGAATLVPKNTCGVTGPPRFCTTTCAFWRLVLGTMSSCSPLTRPADKPAGS